MPGKEKNKTTTATTGCGGEKKIVLAFVPGKEKNPKGSRSSSGKSRWEAGEYLRFVSFTADEAGVFSVLSFTGSAFLRSGAWMEHLLVSSPVPCFPRQ